MDSQEKEKFNQILFSVGGKEMKNFLKLLDDNDAFKIEILYLTNQAHISCNTVNSFDTILVPLPSNNPPKFKKCVGNSLSVAYRVRDMVQFIKTIKKLKPMVFNLAIDEKFHGLTISFPIGDYGYGTFYFGMPLFSDYRQ